MDQSIEELEVNIAEAREAVKLADALERLHNNADFKTVITSGYFTEEATRLVSAKAAPNLQADEMQAAIVRAIDAIGGLQQYFNKLFAQGDMARNAIEASQEEIAMLEAEGAE